MRISAIDNAMPRTNAVNFGTGHEETTDYQTRPHNAGYLKAVPLAVLMAMSPVTTANSQVKPDRLQPQKIEYVEIPSDPQIVRKEVARITYPNASEKYGDATVVFYDTDKNTEDVEEIVIEFHVPRNLNNRHAYDYELVLDHLGIIEYPSSKKTFYGICGNGTVTDTDTYTGKQSTKGINSINVEKPFADYLYNVCSGIEVTKTIVEN